MGKTTSIRGAALLLPTLLLSACEEGGNIVGVDNNAPTAAITTLPTSPVEVGETVSLDGSASSDPDGDALTFEWSLQSQPDGAGAFVTNPDNMVASFVPPTAGSYQVKLTVSDGTASDTETVTITAEAPSEPVELSTVSAETTLKNLYAGAATVDYILPGTIDVNAKLTIEPGVRIQARSGARLDIESSGSIVAIGTADAPIIFEGEADTPGYWEGIRFNSNNPANEVTHAIVAHGGQNGWANVYLESSSQATVTNSTLRDSATCGITVESGGQLTESGNTFPGNESGGVCQ